MKSSLVILLALVVSCYAVTVEAAFRPKPEKRPTYVAREEQVEGLPDYSDPATKAKLDCSACKALVEKVHEDLSKLYDLRHSRPRHFEVVEVTEHMCARIRDEYGLLMRNNQATTDFSRDAAITRMRGAWINTFVEGRCGYILSHYEEAIIENFPKMRQRPQDLQRLVCYKLDKRCAAAEHTHDEL
jgi:hypothetical protein